MNADKAALRAWRLRSQKLGAERWQNPGQVVEWLDGVQAQDYRWAMWSIGVRTDKYKDDEVEQAIRDRLIVRTWMFRGTLHFIAAGDLSWLTALLAPGIIRGNARRYRELELDDSIFLRSQKVVRRALERDGPLTRSEIKMRLEDQGVPAEGQQVPYLLQRAALDGLICQGLPRGNEPTYVLVSDWIGAQGTLDQEKALGVLADRYFASHGPATREDFAWWAGLAAGQARSALDGALKVLPIKMEDVEYRVAGDTPPPEAAESGYLLPPFDEYLLGYKERHLVLDSKHVKRINAGGGISKPTVVVNGQVLGTWNYESGKREMFVSIHPFRNLGPDERDLIERAVDRLGNFKSLSVELSFASAV